MLKQILFVLAVVPASCELQNLQPAPAVPPSVEQVNTETTTARVVSPICNTLIEATPRGLACLHCMHPAAKEQRKVIAQVMENSCLKNLAANFLVDGTFSFDSYAIVELIDPLTVNGRQLFLTFYLSNGPSQRRWKTTSVHGFGTDISPENFREDVLSNEETQRTYQEIVKRLIPVISYANRKGAKVQLVPALEDNLDDASFQKLADLTLAALPGDLVVSIGRNPCRRCYLGNTGLIPNGYFQEVHTAKVSNLIQDGIVTNDGENASLEELKAVRDEASRRNSQFILWDRARQGLPSDLKSYPGVDDRFYEIPSELEQKNIINFLRGN